MVREKERDEGKLESRDARRKRSIRLTSLLAILDELDHIEDSLDDGPLEVVSSLVSKHVGQEGQHGGLLLRELERERPNGLDDDHLELVRELVEEGSDLLHESVNGLLGSGLDERKGKTAVSVGDEQRREGRDEEGRVSIEKGKGEADEP